MFLTGILSWWYTDGLIDRLNIIKERLLKVADFFSIDLMIKTLFAPFRQISAGRVEGPLDVMVHAFFDRLLSRIIGAIMRSFMIIAGIVVLALQVIFGAFIFFAWLIMPILPVAGLIMAMIGWVF